MDEFFKLFLLPMIMVVFGVVFWLFPPKKNKFFGYRSIQSLKNEDTWNYANKTCGAYWFFVGIALMVLSVIVFFVSNSISQLNALQIVKFIVDVVLMLASIPYTEIKLTKKFK